VRDKLPRLRRRESIVIPGHYPGRLTIVLNDRLQTLPEYAFPRLRALLDSHAPGSNRPINLTIGEPRHPYPPFVAEILAREALDYGKYPPNEGTPEMRAAIARWLERRYGLAQVDPDRHVLALNGTREGLFQVAFIAVGEPALGEKPAVLMPNPFYQCYAAAALSAGAEPHYIPAGRAENFLPGFAGLDPALLARTALVYFCSPANPQGTVAGLEYLKSLVALARVHDFLLVVDECYAEIYDSAPPPGGLQAAAALNGRFDNVLVFHSLSKRSNLPGLRSGFVAGDEKAIARFKLLRSYGGAPSPLPVQKAVTAVWGEESHVEENRALYRRKVDAAEKILGARYGFQRPAGGFYLWLDVGDGEAATLKLWKDAGVRVLPGRYLARDDAAGRNPCHEFIRVALVEELDMTEEALHRMVRILGD